MHFDNFIEQTGSLLKYSGYLILDCQSKVYCGGPVLHSTLFGQTKNAFIRDRQAKYPFEIPRLFLGLMVVVNRKTQNAI